MAVVEEAPKEERGSSSDNCWCEQVQHGGIHGASPASFCDKGCPGGTFCSQFHCGGTRARPSIHGCAWLCAPPVVHVSPAAHVSLQHPTVPVVHVSPAAHVSLQHPTVPVVHVSPAAHVSLQHPTVHVSPEECLFGFTRRGDPCSSPPIHHLPGTVWRYLMGEPSAAEYSPKAAVMSAVGGVLVVGMLAIGLVMGVAKLTAKRSRSAVGTEEPGPALL